MDGFFLLLGYVWESLQLHFGRKDMLLLKVKRLLNKALVISPSCPLGKDSKTIIAVCPVYSRGKNPVKITLRANHGCHYNFGVSDISLDRSYRD